MLLPTLVLMFLAAFGLSDIVPLSSSEVNSPSCTLTFTATQPPQIGPTTILYKTIMTTFLYAVDCGICTVTNTPSAYIQGPFSEKTVSSMLTITQVECIPTGGSSIRLHAAEDKAVATATPTAAWKNLNAFKSSNIYRRSVQDTQSGLAELTANFADALPPDVGLLSGGLKDEFSNIATAMLALSICDSKLNLTDACQGLSTAEAKYQLLQSGYNADQAQSIVCFCASYGYDFDTSRQQLYASLYAALIGVLAAADVTTDRGQICDTLGLFNRTGGSLGIDTQQYHDLVCNNIPSATPTTPIWYGPTPIVPFVTNNMTTWGTPTAWMANTTIAGTGLPLPFENATIFGTGTPVSGAPNMTITGTGSPIVWTNNTILPGTGFPDVNATGTGATWGPPESWTGPIGTAASMTIPAQSNGTDAHPTITDAVPSNTTESSATVRESLIEHLPRDVNHPSLPFTPKSATTTHTHSFKRY
ncbi:hypothetical protein H2200_001741 [Cladophialophora chaetospira]|uniref:Uncharacterized protein n=1 Tax=Cladophialophora chaetospira TaxID=386627 RepID=A0AA38XMA3_9EURO|nr:hypothetical protein H2200_001741 [Cladophialophora chaetospira]